MFLFNLTLAQFLAIFGTTSALVVALYLLDRSRRRQSVATLRFWIASRRPAERRHRRRIQQPLSLLLQLIAAALLLLALAQLRFGGRGPASRDHVLILDTGAWMAARLGRATLMEQAQALARAYLRALPAGDRVMVVRADALATPATTFESDRRILEQAIGDSQPGATALNLERALEFAVQAQKLRGGPGGEIAFVGAGRILQHEADGEIRIPPNLRVLPITGAIENCGLRKISLRRSATEPAAWEIFVSVRNYGARRRATRLLLQFGGAPIGTSALELEPGAEREATFRFRTRAAGWLEAVLQPEDNLPGDDRAVLELPPLRLARVVVYSSEADALRPILLANPWVRAEFREPGSFDPSAPADIVILDRFRPPAPPKAHAIWIEPPADGSPLPVRTNVRDATLTRWRSDHALAAGIRTEGFSLERAAVYAAGAGDIAVADTDSGPVVVARDGNPKLVVFGFDPARSGMRYELAFPLLFANILHWMQPDIFRRWELNAGSAGTVTVDLDAGVDADQVKVLAEDGSPLPFTIREQRLTFFSAGSGTARVLYGGGELVYSMTLPQLAEAHWQWPAGVRRGLPAPAMIQSSYWEVWPWLAALGGLLLWLEWLLFGRDRRLAVGGPSARWQRARQWLRKHNRLRDVRAGVRLEAVRR